MFLGYILKVCLEATRKLTEREIEENDAFIFKNFLKNEKKKQNECEVP